LTVIGVIVKLTESPTVTPEPSETAAPSPVIKETIVKEVVLIPCEYCGALMPQTSTFCPNCGARRQT
jgi:rubrerythrin